MYMSAVARATSATHQEKGARREKGRRRQEGEKRGKGQITVFEILRVSLCVKYVGAIFTLGEICRPGVWRYLLGGMADHTRGACRWQCAMFSKNVRATRTTTLPPSDKTKVSTWEL